MPGGLVRVAGEEESVVSMQRGGHSKDAWVLWDGPVDTFSMLRPRDEPVELRRARLICRAAWPTTCSGWAAMLNGPNAIGAVAALYCQDASGRADQRSWPAWSA